MVEGQGPVEGVAEKTLGDFWVVVADVIDINDKSAQVLLSIRMMSGL